MDLFDKVKESLRDKKIDYLYKGLQNLGTDAQMTDSFEAEEEIFGGRSISILGGVHKLSLGTIEIPKGPIRFVNLRRESVGGPGGGWIYSIQYVAPDPKIGPYSPEIEIKSVLKKQFHYLAEWLICFGKVMTLA